MPEHLHLCISMPPKSAVSSVSGFIKGKSAMAMARQFSGGERNFTGEHVWARGYGVSTIGYAEEKVRTYIREQEGDDDEGRFEAAPTKALTVKEQRR